MARLAKTKEKLIELIDGLDFHEWTIDQLHEELLQQGWDVTYTSVFRALNHLESEGYIVKLATESDKVTYEKSIKHHEHLRCDSCGDLVSFDCVLGDEIIRSIRTSTGFVVRKHMFTAVGICASCQKKVAV